MSNHMSDRAVYLLPSSDGLPRACTAWHLEVASPQSLPICLESQAILVAKFDGLARACTACTLELRYVAHPEDLRSRRAPRIDVYLIAALSHLVGGRKLRLMTNDFANQLDRVLERDLPSFHFHPLNTPGAIRKALKPFAVNDLYDIRPPALRIPEIALFPGTPDFDVIVDYMLRERRATMVTVGLQAVSLGAVPEGKVHLSERMLAPYFAGAPGAPDDDEIPVYDLAPARPTRGLNLSELTTALQWMDERASLLRSRAFRVRVQVAGAGRVGGALLTTLEGEFGGPGQRTVGIAWPDPGLALTNPATYVLPRNTAADLWEQSGVADPKAPSEWARAERNLVTLNFEAWGEFPAPRLPTGEPLPEFAPLASLAEYGTALRVFALPQRGSWPLKGMDRLPTPPDYPKLASARCLSDSPSLGDR